MREWESDPLFAAAEVVQDSADRLDSLYRLLLHEQSLVQGTHPDAKLLSLIEHHMRDLATTLETTKWQLEDFEREVNVSYTDEKSQRKQNVMTRHQQFIHAIREQITHVEQSMKNTSFGNPLRNMTLNEQDKDGLALFLSGGKPVKLDKDQESESNDTFRKFLDPTMPSSSKEALGDTKIGEITSLNSNRIENFSTRMGLDPSSSIQEDAYNEDEIRDLEANEAKDRSYMKTDNLRRYKVFGSLGNFLSIYANRANRSFTKRLKDGEDQRQSATQRFLACPTLSRGYCNIHLAYSRVSSQVTQSCVWVQDYRDICQRFLHRSQVRRNPVVLLFTVLSAIFIIGILWS